MFRPLLVVVALTTAGPLTPATGADEPKFKFGEPHKGEVVGQKSQSPGGASQDCYSAVIPVAPNAGQNLSISCTVTGKDRKVALERLGSKVSLVICAND